MKIIYNRTKEKIMIILSCDHAGYDYTQKLMKYFEIFHSPPTHVGNTLLYKSHIYNLQDHPHLREDQQSHYNTKATLDK